MSAADSHRTDAYATLTFLVVLNILNYVDRLLLKSFVVDVTEDLGISYFEFSLLTGLSFALVFAVSGLLLGPLADRHSRPRLIAAGLTVWSALTAATGLATSYAQMIVARGLVAVGEATYAPAALSLLADKFSGAARGRVFGIYYLGLPIGSSLSLLAAGFLGPVLGWRGTFMAIGGLGLVLTVIPLVFMRERRVLTRSPDSAKVELSRLPELFSTLRATPELRWLLVGAVAVVFAQGGLVLDQAWLVKERGYEVAEAQKLFGLIYMGGGIAGALLGGVLGDWAYRKLTGGRAMGLVLIYVAMAPVAVIFRFVPPHTPQFYITAFVGALSVIIPFAAINAAAQEYAPERIRATTTAAVLFSTTFLGASLGNLATGGLVDRLVEQGADQPLTTGLLWNGAVAFLGIPCFFMAARHWARRHDRINEIPGPAPALATDA